MCRNRKKEQQLKDSIKKYVDNIFQLYNSIDNSLIVEEKKINLNSIEIKEVSLHNPSFYFDFFGAIAEYRERLKRGIEGVPFLNDLESRIKNINSIFSKIYTYISLKKESGNVPLIKCINDLFGARIELPISSFKYAHRILNELKEENNWKCKINNASKQEYRAFHLYLMKDNYSLRWEIQFWLVKDDYRNRASHAKYKQAYTRWESMYSPDELFEVCE